MNEMYMGCMPEYPVSPAGYDCGYPMAQKPMYKHEQLVNTIQDCEAVCEHMTTHIKHHCGVETRVKQLVLLRDCADICGLTAKFVARNSIFARDCARLCACICEACGKECARFPDAESQHCARVCFHCARACMAFAGTA